MFCVDIQLEEIKCKPAKFFVFPDSTEVIERLRLYFKQYLPRLLFETKKDCEGRCFKIDPQAIDIIYPPVDVNAWVIINPKDDLSTYQGESFETENSEYAFELELMAKANEFAGVIWNLSQLQNAVKSLLTSLEDNLGMLISIEGFSLTDEAKEENVYVRSGVYKFSILVPSTDSTVVEITTEI